MEITNRGKKWELRNSIWIVWSFTLVFNFVGFFWIGGRTGQRKWIFSGLFYLVTCLGIPLFSTELKEMNSTVYNIAIVVYCIAAFGSIVQSFMSRKEYLVRREAVLDLTEATKDAYRNEIRQDYLGKTEPIQSTEKVQQAKDNSTHAQMSKTHFNQPINLNTAPEEQIAGLPGVGVALAKKAVIMRASDKFMSVEDFCDKLHLMPHFAVQIKTVAYVDVEQTGEKVKSDTGRVLDI